MVDGCRRRMPSVSFAGNVRQAPCDRQRATGNVRQGRTTPSVSFARAFHSRMFVSAERCQIRTVIPIIRTLHAIIRTLLITIPIIRNFHAIIRTANITSGMARDGQAHATCHVVASQPMLQDTTKLQPTLQDNPKLRSVGPRQDEAVVERPFDAEHALHPPRVVHLPVSGRLHR